MPAPIALDHVVINARTSMDEAERLFTTLGFTLTPRGYHSLGSINALAIFEHDYLELLGVPADRPDARPELVSTPLGLNGIVFKTDDADRTYAHLQRLGIDAFPPKSFSRPVVLQNGETHDACFRTVTLPASAFSAGRLYFCEHATPELVWRPEWQAHENGARGFQELVLVSADPVAMARHVAAIIEADFAEGGDGATIALPNDIALSLMTPDRYAARFGDAAIDLGGRTDILGAVTFGAAFPEAVRERAARDPALVMTVDVPGETRVAIPGLNTLLVFKA